MKFSYSRLKTLVPRIKNIEECAAHLTEHLFEIDNISGDTLDVKVLPNRYSDAASHLGLARELSAVYKTGFKETKAKNIKVNGNEGMSVVVKDKKLCRRASAWYFKNVSIGVSPKWLVRTLESCGIRSINNVVDVTNFVMLETGQPLHAFDADKMHGKKLYVRRAKADEKVETLDGRQFVLNPEILVLADEESALDVAGIKGGRKAEVTSATKNILLTACSFDGVGIYKTSRKLNLITDAGIRFSHHLSTALVPLGMNKAASLIAELCRGEACKYEDVVIEKTYKKVLRLDVRKIELLLGTKLKQREVESILHRLGFTRQGKNLIVPLLRNDIETIEDIAEEVGRFIGYNSIPAIPLSVSVVPKEYGTELSDTASRVREVLIGYGFDELRNYSFVREKDVLEPVCLQGETLALENPMSIEATHLRRSLLPGLRLNLKHNAKFFKSIKIFELGSVFAKKPDHAGVKESVMLGLAVFDKDYKTHFFQLKSALTGLLEGLGVTDFSFKPVSNTGGSGPALEIISSGKSLGLLRLVNPRFSECEMYLDELSREVVYERAFTPISKYPSVVRDISLALPASCTIGAVMEFIETVSSKLVRDSDLIDEFDDPSAPDLTNITLRLVFEHPERTLASDEVDAELSDITTQLKEKLNIRIR